MKHSIIKGTLAWVMTFPVSDHSTSHRQGTQTRCRCLPVKEKFRKMRQKVKFYGSRHIFLVLSSFGGQFYDWSLKV